MTRPYLVQLARTIPEMEIVGRLAQPFFVMASGPKAAISKVVDSVVPQLVLGAEVNVTSLADGRLITSWSVKARTYQLWFRREVRGIEVKP